MTLQNYKAHIENFTEDEINYEGRLLNYKNECYRKLYYYTKSNVFLKFLIKEDYQDSESDLKQLCFTLALYGFNGEDAMIEINKINKVPDNYLKDFKYTKNDLGKLYKQLNGSKSFKYKCDFIIRSIISKFAIIQSYVCHDHTFDDRLNFTISEDLQEKLIGRRYDNGEFIYLDVIHKFLHQIQEAFDLADGLTIFYGDNEF